MTKGELQEATFEANVAIQEHGLVILTWGNASACDRDLGVMAIKPSGVHYERLSAEDMVLVELETGEVVSQNRLRPSSDTPTHLVLYRAFPKIGGVVHTHSRFATAWAQSGNDLPCFGTTHADFFCGSVPCTTALGEEEIRGSASYERSTGLVIVREFERRGLDPLRIPAALVNGHGPFVWGVDGRAAVESAVALEAVAEMGVYTRLLDPSRGPIPKLLLDKHFSRKHGTGAYYGQKHT